MASIDLPFGGIRIFALRTAGLRPAPLTLRFSSTGIPACANAKTQRDRATSHPSRHRSLVAPASCRLSCLPSSKTHKAPQPISITPAPLSNAAHAPDVRTSGVSPALLTSGGTPRIHAKKLPLELRASALGISGATTIAFRRWIFRAPQKYSSRTGYRALYFSPVEFFCRLVVPCSMFYEAESEFQIAARTRGAGGSTFHRAPPPRPRIPLVTHRSHALPCFWGSVQILRVPHSLRVVQRGGGSFPVFPATCTCDTKLWPWRPISPKGGTSLPPFEF
jgi:hypothetical protein